MIVGRKVLEHDLEKVCENKNIHTDYKEHLVYREDNDGTTKYTSYEAIENGFINEAHEYLLRGKFNEKDHINSKFSGSLTKIELKPINEKHRQV